MCLDVWLDKSVADKSVADKCVADKSVAFCVMRPVALHLVEKIGNGCACNACASRASAPIETHRAPVKEGSMQELVCAAHTSDAYASMEQLS
jgi:hypothetical protein